MQCNRFEKVGLSRREILKQAANGFGALAMTALLENSTLGAPGSLRSSTLSNRPPQYPAKARNVIFLFMDGGPSQVDTFDPKPRLDREHGQPIKMKVPATQFDNVGNVLKSPWEFKRYGQCGTPVSELFPNVAQSVDDMAIIRSMISDHSEHTNANYFIHSGSGMQGRPSMGAWATYGLGTLSQDLPGFVVLNGGLIPPGGLDCFTNGFLPADYQASIFKSGSVPVANLSRMEKSSKDQREKLNLIRALDEHSISTRLHDPRLESAIENYELAFKMQSAVPELMAINGETQTTQKLYGIDEPQTEIFGRQCLIARRLVERGVRFIELTCPKTNHDRWDQHGGLRKGHADNAAAVDKPIAGLLRDLKARGLLESTLVVWAGEFGRTPMAQGSDGRDHNPYGFTAWMAGGGIKGGVIHGATDDYGYFAVENKVTVHDLHATILHLMGINHLKLTYRYSGRDMRLTDVSGEIVTPILS